MEPRSYRWLKTSKSSSAPVGDRGTNPNSSMISGLSRRLSSLASSGPLYLVFTGATPRRGYPGGVLRQHGTGGGTRSGSARSRGRGFCISFPLGHQTTRKELKHPLLAGGSLL